MLVKSEIEGVGHEKATHRRGNHPNLEGSRKRDGDGRGMQGARDLGYDVLQLKIQVWRDVGLGGATVAGVGA